MNKLFRALVFLAMALPLIACAQSVTATPSQIPSPSATVTLTLVPTQTATATIEPTPEHVQPTLIPTIDPELLHDLLNKALSIQTVEVNGNSSQRITGWNYGFGTDIWYNYCPEYVWLDPNHILLYPGAGQEYGPEGIWGIHNVVPQPVVLNLRSGTAWLPPVNRSPQPTCNWIFWSQELGILITSEIHNDVSTISTYTYDGQKISSYPGGSLNFSPSKTKILVDGDTLIDLGTGKQIKLNWSLENYDEQVLSGLFWTSDETRIYRCCYFYADLTTGISHRFERSDFHFPNGNHLDSSGLWFQNGFWVQADKYFLVWWQAVDDGDIKYLPMFDPATKLFYDVRELAGIPEDFTSLYTPVSPDGNYVWMEGWNESYLVNLATFETQHYTYTNPYSYTDVDWSLDSKFAWFEIYDPDTKSTEVQILSIADMNMNSLPVIYQSESEHLWHPSDNMVVYPAEDKNALIFLDVSTMSFRELSFPDQDSRYKISNLAWSPNGDKLIFITESHTLWQVDHPALENLEQIIASTDSIGGAQWSPDGKTIAFVNGSDIYIVDTTK